MCVFNLAAAKKKKSTWNIWVQTWYLEYVVVSTFSWTAAVGFGLYVFFICLSSFTKFLLKRTRIGQEKIRQWKQFNKKRNGKSQEKENKRNIKGTDMDKKKKKRIIEGNHILCFNNLVDLKARNPRFLILCTRLDFQKVRGQKRPEPSIPYSMYSRVVIYATRTPKI